MWANMMSCLPHPSDSFDNSADIIPDLTDRTFEGSLIT